MAKKEDKEQELGIGAKKAENFSEWYDEVLFKGNVLDIRYPVKGMPAYMPHGFRMLRNCFKLLEELLIKSGHKETLFPILVPEHLFSKEADHIAGFADEVFWATHGGLTELEEKLAIRPTSETIIYRMFQEWIRSYNDLPLMVFQTCTVYRHETKATRPLIRGREIYWNEAHTAHSSWDDVERQIKESVKIYSDFYNSLAIPCLILKRPIWDKFPGSVYSVAFDTLMPDGKVMQIATSHNLGENFSKVYDIKFTNEKGESKFVNQTTYGISMRCLASVIAIHGDDKGLVLPPNIAPIQIAIVPVLFKGFEKDVLAKAQEIRKILEEENKWSIVLDDSEKTAGFKFNEWEMKGVPIRIEIGPRDMKQKQAVLVRRDNGEKINVKEEELKQKIHETLMLIQRALSDKAKAQLKISEATSMAEIRDLADGKRGIEGGFIRVPFCSIEKDGTACGEKLKAKTTLYVRGIRFDKSEKVKEGSKCILCGKDAKEIVYLAKAY